MWTDTYGIYEYVQVPLVSQDKKDEHRETHVVKSNN